MCFLALVLKTKEGRFKTETKEMIGANKTLHYGSSANTATNTCMPGGEITAPNCRFGASVARQRKKNALSASCRQCGNFAIACTLLDNTRPGLKIKGPRARKKG